MWIMCVPYYVSLIVNGQVFIEKNKQTNKKKRNKGKIKGNSNMSYSFSRRFSEAIKLSCIHLTLDDDIPHEAYCAVTLFSVALTYFSVTVRVERWGRKLLWKETLFLNKLIISSVLNELYYCVIHGQFQAHYITCFCGFGLYAREMTGIIPVSMKTVIFVLVVLVVSNFAWWKHLLDFTCS